MQVARFMVSQSIMLVLRGVPAIYAHSFFGSRNYPEGVAATGRYRSINREKLQRESSRRSWPIRRRCGRESIQHIITC